MKVLLSLIFIFNTLFAISINESLLNMHAILVPKITLMDYKFEDKLNQDAISIIIFYDKINYKSAKFLKRKIDLKYADGIKEHPIDVKLVSYEKVKIVQNLKANIYYLLPSSQKNIKNVLKRAKSTSSLTFSYLKHTLKEGCMISLNIGKRVKPILNLEAIRSNNISLRPVLLDISETCNCGTI